MSVLGARRKTMSDPSPVLNNHLEFGVVDLAGSEGTEQVIHWARAILELRLPRAVSVGGCAARARLWSLRRHLIGCALETDDRVAGQLCDEDSA